MFLSFSFCLFNVFLSCYFVSCISLLKQGRNLPDVSDILYFFVYFGAGKGRKSPRRKEGGGYFYLKVEKGGRVPRRGGGVVCTAAGSVAGRGVGAKYFFGAEMSSKGKIRRETECVKKGDAKKTREKSRETLRRQAKCPVFRGHPKTLPQKIKKTKKI